MTPSHKLHNDMLRQIAADAGVSLSDLRRFVNDEGRSLVNAIAACRTVSTVKLINARDRERRKFTVKVERKRARR